VGVVSRKAVLGRARVSAGDRVIAVAASGLHSNGYSLARRVLEQEMKLRLDAHVPELGRTLGEELLTPTRIYANAVASLSAALGNDLHALCHVTGGGIVGNLPRVLPRGIVARMTLDHEIPPIFRLIERGGPVEVHEMRRTFNLGIGLIALVAEPAAERALEALHAAGERAWISGELVSDASAAEPFVEIP